MIGRPPRIKTESLIGQQFNRLTVIAIGEPHKNNKGQRLGDRLVCQCQCGHTVQISKPNLLAGRSESCGCLWREKITNRRGPQNPNWKGLRPIVKLPDGYKFNKDGYILVRLHNELPSKFKESATRPWMFEHIITMAQHIGRPLYHHETVHHKNGIRDDNHISNLELWSHSHPCGQRVHDKIQWAITFLTEQGYAVKVAA